MGVQGPSRKRKLAFLSRVQSCVHYHSGGWSLSGAHVMGKFGSSKKRLLLATVGAAALRAACMSHAQVSGTWLNSGNGTWGNISNWSSNPLYPDGGGIATFSADV